jgi:type III secretion protein J
LIGCQQELFTGLTEAEANRIVATLLDAGIQASKGSSAGVVMVERSRFAEAVLLLEAKGLPKTRYSNFGEVFERKGIVSSPMEERARYIYALSQELSNTISEISGVLSARIHLVLPETDLLGRDVQQSSASIFLTYVEGMDVTQYTPEIRILVANSIEGLLYDNVSVIAIPVAAAVTSPAQDSNQRSVLGIKVKTEAAPMLQAILVILGFILLCIVVGLSLFFSRRSKARAAPLSNEDV